MYGAVRVCVIDTCMVKHVCVHDWLAEQQESGSVGFGGCWRHAKSAQEKARALLAASR
uniref:Uncharacterized protein n=1 Tax=Oryza sativa subsp. japonica TaxID=39947 RepID=Q69XU6_ORYSJ|nr:hypothetical protein [Oryza sativa Japonica Group]BAD62218.1 hypothetical protein [Oryza sativa Japonica Group]